MRNQHQHGGSVHRSTPLHTRVGNSRYRRLHLVDIENLICDHRPNTHLIRQCQRRYLEIARPQECDLVVVGCSHWMAKAIMFDWRGPRFVVRSGEDGADMALLEVWEDLSTSTERFAEVLIASGDHIFGPLASEIARERTLVTVISRPEALAPNLRMAAGRILSFDESVSGVPERIPKWSQTGALKPHVGQILAI